MRYRCHVFVCTNTRPEGGKPSCGSRGGVELVAALQRAVSTTPSLIGDVAVTPSGCLGPCFDGANLVVYPAGEWLAGVTLDDVDDIVAYLAGGAPVTRLRYEWPLEGDVGTPDE